MGIYLTTYRIIKGALLWGRPDYCNAGRPRRVYLLTEIDVLSDSHFPGSQRVLRTGGGVYINYLRGAFHQKPASSTIEGNGIMNTVTEGRAVLLVLLVYTAIGSI